MSLVERTDLRRTFPEYHDAFVGIVGAEHILAEQHIGVEGLSKILDIYSLVTPVAKRAAELQKMRLGPAGHAQYMQFGEEVLGNILDLSRDTLHEDRQCNYSTGDYVSAPLQLAPSADANSWRFARTKLHIMQLHGDKSDLNIDQLKDNPRKHDGFTPWVWRFGIDIYAKDPEEGVWPLLEQSSPCGWYRDVYMEPYATNGRMLLDMYRLAHTLDVVRDRLPQAIGPLATQAHQTYAQ